MKTTTPATTPNTDRARLCGLLAGMDDHLGKMYREIQDVAARARMVIDDHAKGILPVEAEMLMMILETCNRDTLSNINIHRERIGCALKRLAQERSPAIPAAPKLF